MTLGWAQRHWIFKTILWGKFWGPERQKNLPKFMQLIMGQPRSPHRLTFRKPHGVHKASKRSPYLPLSGLLYELTSWQSIYIYSWSQKLSQVSRLNLFREPGVGVFFIFSSPILPLPHPWNTPPLGMFFIDFRKYDPFHQYCRHE